ncbi:hypothetical protein BD769DRAFT_1341920, partial [Suillus cothurnatus]
PSQLLGVLRLSIRIQEWDLDEEFSRFGRVEKVTVVHDQSMVYLHCPNVFFSPTTRYLKKVSRIRYFRQPQKTKFKTHFILNRLPASVPHFVSLYYYVPHY